MNALFHSCEGDSHKANDIPCQDYAYAESCDTLSMAIVSDGHGGERYFRSQYGAMFAVEITKEAIKTFVKDTNSSVFKGAHFTAYKLESGTEKQIKSKAHHDLQWLFSSIISQWNIKIAEHAVMNELSKWEISHVKQEYTDDFNARRQQPEASYEKIYGCTLMAYIQTQEYWFAFQIGDGKCVSMRLGTQGELICEQPIPWDDKCFLNKTTSLCDSDAINEFRYCYQEGGEFPLAMFLGSDGMDDSFGDGEKLYNFYIELLKIIAKSGIDEAKKELEKSLPVISQRGSKDDMSVALVCNDKILTNVLTYYQIKRLEEQLGAIEIKRQKLSKEIQNFDNLETPDRSQQINSEYAKKDLEKADLEVTRIKKKISTLKEEITTLPAAEEDGDKEKTGREIQKEITTLQAAEEGGNKEKTDREIQEEITTLQVAEKDGDKEKTDRVIQEEITTLQTAEEDGGKEKTDKKIKEEITTPLATEEDKTDIVIQEENTTLPTAEEDGDKEIKEEITPAAEEESEEKNTEQN